MSLWSVLMKEALEKCETYSLSLFSNMFVLVKVILFPDLLIVGDMKVNMLEWIKIFEQYLDSLYMVLTSQMYKIDVHVWCWCMVVRLPFCHEDRTEGFLYDYVHNFLFEVCQSVENVYLEWFS